MLADRANSDLAPFVDSWDAKITQLDDLHVYKGSRNGNAFAELPTYIKVILRDIVWLPDGISLSYLAPLLKLLSPTLSVYSLNYDNAIERLCQQSEMQLSLGIARSGKVAFSKSAVVRLMKLHGSIDWIEEGPFQSKSRPLPMSGIRQVSEEEMQLEAWRYAPGIIFGRGNKLTASGPYLDLLRQFRDDLRKQSTLLVVGYSFRDDHINYYIRQWFNSKSDRRIIVVNGKRFAEGQDRSAFADELCDWGSHWHPGRVITLPQYACDGIPEAVEIASSM